MGRKEGQTYSIPSQESLWCFDNLEVTQIYIISLNSAAEFKVKAMTKLYHVMQ